MLHKPGHAEEQLKLVEQDVLSRWTRETAATKDNEQRRSCRRLTRLCCLSSSFLNALPCIPDLSFSGLEGQLEHLHEGIELFFYERSNQTHWCTGPKTNM